MALPNPAPPNKLIELDVLERLRRNRERLLALQELCPVQYTELKH